MITAIQFKQAAIQGHIDALEDRLNGHDCPSPSPHTCSDCWPVRVRLNALYRELNTLIKENVPM